MSHSKTRSRRHDLVVVVLLTFALCVAMNVAIFAVIHSALLRCLPFPTPDFLVTVFETHPIVEFKPHRAAAMGILTPDFADLVDKRVRLPTHEIINRKS